MSSFNAAARKLAAANTPYPIEDLPLDSNDTLWTLIRSEYGLTLPELGALKNYQQRRQNQIQLSSASGGVASQEDVRELKMLILEREMAESRAVSYSEYYQEKLRQGRVEQWNPVESFDADELQLPNFLRTACDYTGSEKTVQSFWRGILQQHKIISSLQNGFEIAHLGTKIPDIAFFREGIATPGAADFVAAGDCKGSSWTGTSSAEFGQMLLYLHRMLDCQPVREVGYGFLTNNEIIVLVKAYMSSPYPFHIRWCISNVLNFDHGMKLWIQIMKDNNGYSGPPSVFGYPITVQRPLRPGGTCRAFAATYCGKVVVANLYLSAAVAADNASRTRKASQVTLGATSSANSLARIPHVVATENCWSLITPRGEPMTRDILTKIHVQHLVSTLQIIHAAGIIHRDVRISNIFYLTDRNVLLNDWGSSVVANERTMYAGSPKPHIHPEIALTDLYDPHPKHDLYSLVSSVAQLLLPGANTRSRRDLFTEAFQSAEACDYEGVYQGIAKCMKR